MQHGSWYFQAFKQNFDQHTQQDIHPPYHNSIHIVIENSSLIDKINSKAYGIASGSGSSNQNKQ